MIIPWLIAVLETVLGIWAIIDALITGQVPVYRFILWIAIAIIFVWCWALGTKKINKWKDMFFKHYGQP